MNANDYLLSLVRTWVPIAIGAVLVWAARHWGIVLSSSTSAQAAIVATSVVSGLYYALVRGLEARWPVFGRLLGAMKLPSYAAPVAPAKGPSEH